MRYSPDFYREQLFPLPPFPIDRCGNLLMRYPNLRLCKRKAVRPIARSLLQSTVRNWCSTASLPRWLICVACSAVYWWLNLVSSAATTPGTWWHLAPVCSLYSFFIWVWKWEGSRTSCDRLVAGSRVENEKWMNNATEQRLLEER